MTGALGGKGGEVGADVLGGEIVVVGAPAVVFEGAADDADVGVFGAATEALRTHDMAALIEEGIQRHQDSLII